MAQEELWPNFALKIGKQQREIYIVDDFLGAGAIEDIYRQFLAFPYVLGGSDRSDTTHVRHLLRTFDLKELEADTPLAHFAQFVRRFLDANQLDSGPVSSLSANFNRHGDYQFIHEDGPCWTSLFFVNAQWKEDWGGELLLYGDKSSDPAYAVFPKPGRLCIFDGRIPHRGGSPSRHCFEPRISLAIKFDRPSETERDRTLVDALPGDARA